MMSNGTKIGQYEIVSELGSGGMATVYKAYQRTLNRFVALKLLPDTLARDRAFIERFVREARIAASLKHPNIVTIYEISDSAPYFIAMEYIEGGSLATLIRQHGALDTLRVAAILRQVADALDVAHSRQVIHRDLKPSNIMLDERGRAILTDFGIARAMDATKLTQTGTVMGTPEYMAPEEIQGQTASAHSDIYALGIVVYEMLTGRTPFRAETPLALMHQHVYNAPPSLRQFNPTLSSHIERIVNKAIAKKPTERFESAGSFASMFEAAVSGAKGSNSTKPTVVAPTLPRRISPIFLIGILAAVLVLIVAFVFFLTRPSDITPQVAAIPTATSSQTRIENTVAPLPSSVPTLVPVAATLAVKPTFIATATATPTLTARITPDETATAGVNQTSVAQSVQGTVDAQAAATAEAERIATAISRTQTAAAALTLAAIPTTTPIPTQRPTLRPTAIPRTATPVPIPPTATPARSIFPLYLTSPDPGSFFGDENRPPLLQWQPATDLPLDENMFYRIQTSHNDAPACNIYTKRTIYQLPPSKQPGEGCDPNRWQFNTGDWVWRVSFVTRMDGDVSHDIEWTNSEGRLFKWNK